MIRTGFLKRVRWKAGPSGKLDRGSLELRGVRTEIRFPATASTLPGSEVVLEAHFDIDRTRWAVIYGSSRFFEHLGRHLVFDLISIQLRIVTGG